MMGHQIGAKDLQFDNHRVSSELCIVDHHTTHMATNILIDFILFFEKKTFNHNINKLKASEGRQ
jgi:hypothetical protein